MFKQEDIKLCSTRSEQIANGVLIDVTTNAQEAGILIPVAVTDDVWDKFVRVPAGVHGQNEDGRLWDILWMLRHVIRSRGPASSHLLYVHVRNDDRPVYAPVVRLEAYFGKDDDGKPCITVSHDEPIDV